MNYLKLLVIKRSKLNNYNNKNFKCFCCDKLLKSWSPSLEAYSHNIIGHVYTCLDCNIQYYISLS